MKEADYQKKIIKAIESIGGTAINGKFSITGTADLICGYPFKAIRALPDLTEYTVLRHLHVEVKTPKDYDRVFRSIEEVEGRYVFKEDIKSLKPHEYLQITKLNIERDKGGLALIAHSFEQVKDYVCSTY